MTNQEEGNVQGWRIDRRVPVWGVVIVVGQGLIWGCLMYFTLYQSQVNLDKRVAMIEAHNVSDVNFAVLSEKLNTVKEDVGGLKQDISSFKEEFRKITFSKH